MSLRSPKLRPGPVAELRCTEYRDTLPRNRALSSRPFAATRDCCGYSRKERIVAVDAVLANASIARLHTVHAGELETPFRCRSGGNPESPVAACSATVTVKSGHTWRIVVIPFTYAGAPRTTPIGRGQ